MDSHDIERYLAGNKRTMLILFVVVAMVAASGFFMGMRQTKDVTGRNSDTPWLDNVEYDAESIDAPQAPKYTEESSARWRVNDDWQSHFASLRAEPTPREPTGKLQDEQLAAALKSREARRAFDTAPPVVPHAIDEHDPMACVACHSPGNSRMIGSRLTPEMSHPYLTSCTQCHVPAHGQHELVTAPNESGTALAAGNSFIGQQTIPHGTIAYQGAPPVLPHPVWMRQNCLACHGEGRPSAIQTSHPQRQNCLQCHAENHIFDNREQLGNEMPLVTDLIIHQPAKEKAPEPKAH